MKRTFLIITAIILLSSSGNCQWYQWRYGVNDIKQLSRDQLNEALSKAKKGTRVGLCLSFVGVAGIISTVAIYSNVDDRPGDFTPAFLVLGMIPIAITGLTVMSVNSSRKSKIIRTLMNSEISLGFTNIPTGNLYRGSNIFTRPNISVTINF
jgi:hypothetical protein